MRQAAANLEFVRAAGLRDQIKQLRNHELGLGKRVRENDELIDDVWRRLDVRKEELCHEIVTPMLVSS